MFDKDLADTLRKQDRNRISYLPRGRFDTAYKRKGPGKSLKGSRFTYGDWTILCWMTESTVGNARALRREHQRRHVEAHSSVTSE